MMEKPAVMDTKRKVHISRDHERLEKAFREFKKKSGL
jgi:hypothetical protein